MYIPMASSGQRVMKVVRRMVMGGWPVRLQITLAAVGVGGVFAVAPGAGRGDRWVFRSVQEDGVRVAPGGGAPGQGRVLGHPGSIGGGGP